MMKEYMVRIKWEPFKAKRKWSEIINHLHRYIEIVRQFEFLNAELIDVTDDHLICRIKDKHLTDILEEVERENMIMEKI